MAGPAKRESRAKTTREREQRLAAVRAEQARRERGRRVKIALAASLVLVVVIGVLVVVRLVGGGGGSSAPSESSGRASAAVVQGVTTVPPATLDAIGPGSVTVVPRKIDAPALTSDGKPKILYVGGEFCPFCAAQRWAVVVALSRFGTWSDLGATTSATQDVFPSTPSLSFHGATYASQYVAFTGVETTTNQPLAGGGGYTALDSLSSADQKIVDTYDVPKYTGGSAGSVPFLDLGGRSVLSGSSYSPQLLAGKSAEEVAASLSSADDPIAQGILGGANVLTAEICRLTANAPTEVCTAKGVVAAAAKLPAS